MGKGPATQKSRGAVAGWDGPALGSSINLGELTGYFPNTESRNCSLGEMGVPPGEQLPEASGGCPRVSSGHRTLLSTPQVRCETELG